MRRKRRPMDVYIGWSPDETVAYRVACASLCAHTDHDAVAVRSISRQTVWEDYRRPTGVLPNGRLFDEISDAPMSTDHAIARFFVPHLHQYHGWALFTDGDVLFRRNIHELFDLADPRFAVMVVQHEPYLSQMIKKSGHIQQNYPRKNWSSVILWNCAHPAHRTLTLEVLNTWPGRDLHAFRWLEDDLVGELPEQWNHLVGIAPQNPDAHIVHYTLGTPDLPGHEHDEFADEWRQYLEEVR